MSYPATTSEYYFPQLGTYQGLTLRKSPLRQPKASEVLVKVHAVSLQFRDLTVANNAYPPGSIARASVIQEDLVPCSDMAGEVIAAGEDVRKWKRGDRVCANFALDHVHGPTSRAIQFTSQGGQSQGVLTEYKLFPAHSLVRIPEQLSYEEASTLPCAALTAYNALLGGAFKLKGGDTVLVQGTGGVSIFALQFAVASGATVIATSSSDQKLEIAKKLGATYLINYKKTPEWDQEVMKYTNNRGVDHILEVGGPGTFARSVKAIRIGAGLISSIGSIATSTDDISVGLQALRSAAVTVRGIQIGSVSQFEDMNRLIAARDIHPVIDKIFAFNDVKEAYAYLESQKHVGKVVIKVSKD